MRSPTTSEGSLKEKAVLVTGAGRGIGREIALLAAAEGAAVVVNDLGTGTDGQGADTGPATHVVKEIVAAGGRAVTNGDSVSEADGAQRMVEQALDTFGRLDGVVNNAGILRDRIFHKMEQADWDAVIAVHLNGMYNVARAASATFRKQQSGSYIHFTSSSGLIGNVGQVNYAAAKMGVVGLSKGIALDMAAFGVRSNCIAPTAMSRMIATIPDQSRIDQMKSLSPARIAPLVAYLLSDESRDVTGQVFGVRGNEIYLYSQPLPIRSVHRAEGWTVQSIAEHAMPALRPSFVPSQRSRDVFRWDPI